MTQELRDLVRRRRTDLGLTQVELSERAGMSQEWASGVERGKIKHPRRESLLKLADALELPHEAIVVAAGLAPSRQAARQMLELVEDADVPGGVPASVVEALNAITWTKRTTDVVLGILATITRADALAARQPTPLDTPAEVPHETPPPVRESP